MKNYKLLMVIVAVFLSVNIASAGVNKLSDRINLAFNNANNSEKISKKQLALVSDNQELIGINSFSVGFYRTISGLFSRKEQPIVSQENIDNTSDTNISEKDQTETKTQTQSQNNLVNSDLEEKQTEVEIANISKVATYQKQNQNTQPATIINNPVQEKVVERVVSGVSVGDLQSLKNELLSEIYKIADSTNSQNNANYRAIALTNKIDNLSSVTINNSTITGGTITGANLSGSTLNLSSSLTVTNGTFSGDLSTGGNFTATGNITADGYLTVSGVATSTFAGGISANDLIVSNATSTRSNLGLAYATNTDLNFYNVAMWGDSLTVGTAPQLANLYTDHSVYNEGVGGETSIGIKTRMVADTNKHDFITVIWAGTNNRTSPTTIKTDIATMISNLEGTKRYVVIGLMGASTDVSGSANYNTVQQLNTDLSNLYPSNYIDIRSYLISDGLTDAGISPTAQDTTDIANDVVPDSLRSDTIHLTTTGYQLVAQQIINFIDANYPLPTDNKMVSYSDLDDIANALPLLGTINIKADNFLKYDNFIFSQASTTLKNFFTAGGGARIGDVSIIGSATGESNVGTGYGALSELTTGNYNTANGNYALYHNTEGVYNVGIGFSSLQNNTTGNYNTALGTFSLYKNTTGAKNQAIGTNTLYQNTIGSANVAIGYSSLKENISGTHNIGIGQSTLQNNTTGGSNIALGNLSLFSNNGTSNIGIGVKALYLNTTGNYNLAQGWFSGYSNTTGGHNFFAGYEAGSYIADGSTPNTTGDYNIFIGDATKALADNDQNEIVIGYNATGIGSNSVVLGNDSITTTALKGNVGIGTTSPQSKLEVSGGDIRVTGGSFIDDGSTLTVPDYVFEEDYGLMAIGDLESYITENKHLPNVPDMNDLSGWAALSLQDRDMRLLEKTEENVLYIINNHKSVQDLASVVESLNTRVESLVLDNSGNYTLNTGDVVAYFESLGAKFIQGVAYLKDVFVEKLTIGTSEKPTGITLYDKKTGEPYCLEISDGVVVNTAGECSSVDSLGGSETTPTNPTIQILGNNPAEIEIGTSYVDLGVIAQDYLGNDLSVNINVSNTSTTTQQNVSISGISLDTSTSTVYTIKYSVIDNDGLTAEAEREVIVGSFDQAQNTDQTQIDIEITATTTPEVIGSEATTTPEVVGDGSSDNATTTNETA